jgi:DegV family protein with EDD domain
VSAEDGLQSTHPRRSVAVVTDSTPYLPRALLERWGVQQVSLYVGWNGDLQPERDYGDFLACYGPLLRAGHDVVSVHIANGLSGTCESAREAARTAADEGLPGRVHVLDSQTGAGGLGCLVLLAARVAAQGASLEEVIDSVKTGRESLDIWFCLDTLEYLRRGGRIGAAQALLGTALKVKPILTFGTEIAPVGRVRTHRRALERMVAYLRELQERGATEWIVQHAQSSNDAEQLVAQGTALFGFPPLFCTEVGPVLGAHLGSGMLVGGMTAPGD